MRFFIALLFAAVPAAVSAAPYDAVIVGGGLSGLSAAKQLAASNKTYVVLEARDRVGGRVENMKLENGGVTEVGAEFVGPTQNKVLALAKELNLEVYDTYNEGKNVLWQDGKRQLFDAGGPLGALPPEDPTTLLQLASAQSALDKLAQRINIDAPWTSQGAAELDSESVEDWLRKRHISEDAHKVMELAIVEIFSADLKGLSMLYVATYVAAAGDRGSVGTFERLTQTKNGAQAQRIKGGTGLLATRLAKKLGKHSIKLESPVASIARGDQKNSTYTVTTKSGKEYRGRHIIVAMSPPMAEKIEFQPELPASRRAVQQKMKMGSIGKGIAVFKTPFWRKKGLSGQVLSDDFVTRATFDGTPYGADYGVVMSFIQAEQMRAKDDASDDELQKALTKALGHYFGKEKPQSFLFKRWDNEEYSGGGPTANAAPGVFYKHGSALRKAVGNLHFAGTESSDHWIGYMDGAIRAGVRAAREVK
ncbi:monoamine oxidase [Malassezia sp. CBS 17886]|nr:monoamine oxidase [Malassezia sp. CBS 17886]